MSDDLIRAELEALLEKAPDGILHAESVVEWAKTHRKSALYEQFEWNDQEAADQYRLWQARRLIQLHVTTADGTPKLISLRYDRPRGGGYRRIDDVMDSRELAEKALRDAIADLERIAEKYRWIKKLSKVWTELDELRAEVSLGDRKRVRSR